MAGTAHDRTMLDRMVSPRFEIGSFGPPIREYLLGGMMPPDTAVIVIVASDDEARNVWTVPSLEDVSDEVPCISFRFLVRGIFFRVMMGRHLPQVYRQASCTTWRKCLWYGSMKRRMPEIMAIFDEKGGNEVKNGR